MKVYSFSPAKKRGYKEQKQNKQQKNIGSDLLPILFLTSLFSHIFHNSAFLGKSVVKLIIPFLWQLLRKKIRLTAVPQIRNSSVRGQTEPVNRRSRSPTQTRKINNPHTL